MMRIRWRFDPVVVVVEEEGAGGATHSPRYWTMLGWRASCMILHSRRKYLSTATTVSTGSKEAGEGTHHRIRRSPSPP